MGKEMNDFYIYVKDDSVYRGWWHVRKELHRVHTHWEWNGAKSINRHKVVKLSATQVKRQMALGTFPVWWWKGHRFSMIDTDLMDIWVHE